MPAVVDRGAAVGAHAHARCGDEDRQQVLDGSPDDEAGGEVAAVHVLEEVREADLGAARAARQRHCVDQQLKHGARRRAQQKVRRLAERAQHEVRQRVHATELEQGDHHGQAHLEHVGGRALEVAREDLDLRVHELIPLVVLLFLDPTVAVRQLERPVANGHDGLGQQAHGHDGRELHDLEAKEEDADEGHVAERLVEVAAAKEQHDGGEYALAGLVEHEAGEVQGARLAHREPGAREAEDLRRLRAHAGGRHAHKEDAGRLDAHEVADTHGRVGVVDDRQHIGEHAEDVIEKEADDARDNPPDVDAGKRRHELVDLAGKDKVDRIGDHHKEEEDEGLAGLAHRLLVGLVALHDRDLLLGRLAAGDLEGDLLLWLLELVCHAMPLCCGYGTNLARTLYSTPAAQGSIIGCVSPPRGEKRGRKPRGADASALLASPFESEPRRD